MKDNVQLRPLRISDKTVLAELANNKKIWDNLRDYFPFPYQESDAEFFIDLTATENPQKTFGITYHGELCGVIGLDLQKDVYQKSAELGYWIGEPYWGRGIATKAVALITKYGFDHLDLNRIFAAVFDYNTISMKILEKNGFQKEGIFKSAIVKNKQCYDEHRYYKLNKSKKLLLFGL